MKITEAQKSVERWGMVEVSVNGPSDGNPFTEQEICGTFTGARESVTVPGFYDGNGIYKVRFMPSFTGNYSYRIEASFGSAEGEFSVSEPAAENHGPVRTAFTFHFSYEDGTRYIPIGTTCYVWDLQSDEQIAQTLKTLEENAFNKIRFCVFPKHYAYNLTEPRSYPYEGTPMDSSILTK
ncbi:MAG TPA: DUF5060 domain-containing protein, partial [Lachnospiraceae bacterium]|nr:DUF5060 domain-containing protein [Lachnospiraceae bacterium]